MPAKFREEQRWFSSPFLRPGKVPADPHLESDCMLEFQHLIWNQPSRKILQGYGSTREELARLCGSGPDGWLCSSHIMWILDRINEAPQLTSLGICISASPADELARLIKCKDVSNVERLIFVANVGKNPDNSVFLSTPFRSGSHWVLITVELSDHPAILYCDSNGWNYPPDLMSVLSEYTQHFGLLHLREISFSVMHTPTPLAYNHFCTTRCRNYPIQTCSNVCGLVAVVCSVIAALDQRLFTMLTGPRSGLRMYLHEPTRYERYLRRVLISWFVRGGINMTPVWQWLDNPFDESDAADFSDHSYCAAAARRRKRRAPETAPPPPQSRETPGKQATGPHTGAPPSHTGAPPSHTGAPPSHTGAPPSHTGAPPRSKSNSKKQYICPYCRLHTSSRQALHKHKRRYHRHEDDSRTNVTHCLCHLCPEFACLTIQQLIGHHKTEHGENINIETKEFCSEEDFLVWKKQAEKDTSSQFFKTSGQRTFKEYVTTYFNCHRSGEEKCRVSDNDRKRAKKSQGSQKIGFKCTAFMTVRKHLASGKVTVQYCFNHIGHSLKMGHLKLSDEMRSLNVGKLAQGVEIGKILDEIRDKLSDVTRDTLVSRKDIQNLKNQYNISGTQKHPDDGTSVEMWVHDLKSEPEDPIIYYKPQGTPHDTLKPEDFLLCIQTNFQREMTTKYSTKIVCIDSTHKTTQYDFLLTTVLVLDEFEEAIPVAWAISNREDAELLEVFFQSLRNSCGQDLQTHTFMSDLASNFFNAWCAIFSRPTRRLYCSWHVDKCWRKQIQAMIHSHNDQCSTYAFLKVLQSDTDEANFRKSLQQFLAFLEPISPTFLKYFSKNFVENDKIKLWAACFRMRAVANTNMFAEAFHRVLKDIYFSRKQNRRVDYLLVTLIKIARDKAVEELTKLEKGKVTHRLREIRNRHKQAVHVKGIQRNNDVDAEWSVPSSTIHNKVYYVKRVLNKMCSCKLVCDYCKVCVHTYTCTCPDFLTKTVTCKHIHAVHKENQGQHEQPANNDDPENEDNISFYKTLLCNDKPESSTNIERLKIAALSKASDIMELVNKTNDVATVQAVLKRLQEAHKIGCGLQGCSATQFQNEKKTEYPPNKKFEKQRRIFSTKRKNKKNSKLKLKKPDRCDTDKITSDLSENQAVRCAICFREDDNQDNPDVDWFECVSCQCWIHVTCDVQLGDDGELGQCSLCRNKQ